MSKEGNQGLKGLKGNRVQTERPEKSAMLGVHRVAGQSLESIFAGKSVFAPVEASSQNPQPRQYAPSESDILEDQYEPSTPSDSVHEEEPVKQNKQKSQVKTDKSEVTALPDYSEENVVENLYDERKLTNSTERAKKDMSATLEFFSKFFEADETVPAAKPVLDSKWITKAYEKYVMGAKRIKKNSKEDGLTIRFTDDSGNALFFVRLGKPNETLRTDVRYRRITFPDFLACISIMAIYQDLHQSLPPAPLGAHVTKSDEKDYKETGLHICGHSGLSSVANFSNAMTEKGVLFRPNVKELVALAFFIDTKHRPIGDKEYPTIQAIARTTGKTVEEMLPAPQLIKDFIISETNSASAINARSVAAAISDMIGQSSFQRNRGKEDYKTEISKWAKFGRKQ